VINISLARPFLAQFFPAHLASTYHTDGGHMRFSLTFLRFVGFAGLTVLLGSGCSDSGTDGSVGMGGRGGAGGGLADVALGEAGASGGLDSGEDGNGRGGVTGTGGVVGDSGMDGTGRTIDGGLDGAGGEGRIDAACIQLADLPTVQISAADSSVQIRSLGILSGPCTIFSTMMSAVEFPYWEKGYSCPRGGDTVTCQVEVTSSLGSVAVVTVKFIAVGLSSTMLYWQPQPQPKVSFSPLDGAVAE
jgi:hypothetical protein